MNASKVFCESQKLILAFQRLRKIIFDKFSEKDKTLWQKRFTKKIYLCNTTLRSAKLSIGLKRKLQTILQQLKAVRKIISIQYHVGAGFWGVSAAALKKRVVWENVVSCFQGRVRTGVIINLIHKDVLQFLIDAFKLFEKKIKSTLQQFPVIKVNTTFCGEFIRASNDRDVLDVKYFNTKNAIIDLGTDIREWFLNHVQDEILNKLSEFQERDSGFALRRIIYLEVNINKMEIGNGSSYIELPREISNKKACINIKNNDQACFYWSVVCGLS
jgi:hypothetical protein